MQSIRETALKIKAVGLSAVGEWGIALLVILAVFGAFGLGRLSVLLAPKGPVLVQNTASAAIYGVGDGMALGGAYVASRTGEIYYFPWCTGADKIAAESKRWFGTEAAAKKAGYRPAKNCKGLVID